MVFLLIFILSRFSTFDPRCARPEKGNSHPPAQPGVLSMRAKPYFTGYASRRWYGLPLAKSLLLATRKRVCVLLERHLILNLIFHQLILDVLGYRFIILSCGIYKITSTPECPIPVFVLQIRMTLKNQQGAFSFEKAYKSGHTHLRWYLDQHVNVVGTHLCFYDFYLFPCAKLSQYFSYLSPHISICYFSTILGCKRNVVFAIPARMI